jgi:hypothetical protein
VDGGDKRRRRGGSPRCLDESGDVLAVQAAQNDPLEEALTGQLGQRLGKRVPARELDVAIRADQEQSRVGQLAREELEEAQ